MSSASTPSHSTPFSTYSDNPADREYNHHEFESLRSEFSTNMGIDSLNDYSQHLLICTACGTQFDVSDPLILTRCRICDDERQFVPPSGQSFTTLSTLKNSRTYSNRWAPLDSDERFWSIWTEPKFGIGQRAILIRTPQGNILWDCITYLDPQTINWINSLGGLSAILISHPHYYTSHLEWASTFECPIYLSWDDKGWINRLDRLGKARTFIQGEEEEIEIHGERTGVKALKLGGHFPGSLVCLAFGRLLVADTLVTTPAGLGDWSKSEGGRPEGMNTFAFMWSIPNMIPLSPEEIAGMWRVLKKHDFSSTHGAFVGTDIRDRENGSVTRVKKRVLDSMQIQVRRMGWRDHAFLRES